MTFETLVGVVAIEI